MHKYNVVQRGPAPDEQLAAVPPPITEDTEVDSVVADKWQD